MNRSIPVAPNRSRGTYLSRLTGRVAGYASLAALVTTMVLSAQANAQAPSKADSQLVARILVAEDRRDSASMAFHDAASHDSPQIRELARRALARTRDVKFTERTTFTPLPAPPAYTDGEWRLRYRALRPRLADCAFLRTGLEDAHWAVRLRAADLVAPACAGDSALVRILTEWSGSLPLRARRANGQTSWHASAHALSALARVAPAAARLHLPKHAGSTIPWVRTWSARTATTLADTATLKKLSRDANDNVKEAAVEGLSKVAGHSADGDYIAVLSARGYQAVRVAASALAGSPRGDDVLKAALAASRRLKRDSSETSRDARSALLARIAEFATAANAVEVSALTSDFDCRIADSASALATRLGATGPGAAAKCEAMAINLPPDAVALALGRDVRIRVTLADSSGGGSFIVRLRGDNAPIMAARVLSFARAGYYDGFSWQRVEPDFVVQGGGPGANEYVGHPRFMRDELGGISHARGTIGMSTRGHDTGDGQWFFNLKNNANLDPLYTVFAEVSEGMEVVDGIMEGDVIARMEILRR